MADKRPPRQKKNPVTGRLIERWRAFFAMSQKQLAELVGVTQGAVSAWEEGWTDPAERRIPKIAEAFGKSVPEFYEGPPEPAVVANG
jgi:transcriptional regulator with XRE-family HTH domain